MGFSVLGIGLAMADHKRFRSARTEKDNLPFSDAVWAGDTLYISGHLGLDPATGRPPASASDEARMMLDAFKKTVETAGLTMQDLVFIQIYLFRREFVQRIQRGVPRVFQRWIPCPGISGIGQTAL